jgi:hypothetical protein
VRHTVVGGLVALRSPFVGAISHYLDGIPRNPG